MNRIDIINSFIQKYGYKSYLEIGCQYDQTFKKINVERKVGVDPEVGGTMKMTSDEYFAQNSEKFDIIFIDGLHHSEQVLKDIDNSLKILNKGGVIVVHDLLPTNLEMQLVPRITKAWTGDVWKAWVNLRMNKGNLNMVCIDTDMGCGIIRRGKQAKLVTKSAIEYKNFEKNKKNCIS